MAIATAQELAPTGVSSFVDGFSHATTSMASAFPHQMLFHHSTCKGAASMTPVVLPFRTVDCGSVETDNDYGFEDTSQPLYLQYTLVESVGAGLANLGNTCFLNSVLQCLTYTPPLSALLQAGLHNRSCNIKSFCAMCAMERHVRDALSSTGKIISPSHLVKNLRSISRTFQLWRQEDAHEYMRYLIEALKRCCSAEFLGGESLIKGLFGGRLRSQVKCTHCSHCSNKYDPFLDLSLEVNRADSLNKALAHFTATEILDGDNKYHCSKCKTKVRALKQFTIDKAPPILTVQLKRFSSSGSHGGKIDKKVHFERDLDLTPFVTEAEDEKLSYSLYAVLVHSGRSTHSGHYFCFVRTATDTWHVMDDSEVSQVSENTVLAQKAYILFYVRNVRSTILSEANSLEGNFNYAITSSLPANDHQEMCCNLEMSENRSALPHDNKQPLVSNDIGCASAAKQEATSSKVRENIGKSASIQLEEKLPFPEVLGIDEGKCALSSSEKSASSNTAKDFNAGNLNNCSEESWYRVVQIINNSSVDSNNCLETQPGGFFSSNLVAEAQEDSCAREQNLCNDVPCRDDTGASSRYFVDDVNVGAESDETSTPKPYCELQRHSFFNFVSPLLRTARFERAGQHALSILCMCAKYCFWSCFWPPL